MGTAATVANVPEILKTIWKDEIFDFQYENSPFYGQIEKDTSWDGISNIITVQYGGMSGRSATFSNAQDNKGPPKYKKMTLETADNFALWSVDHKLITLSRNQRGALVRALAENTEKAMTKFKRSVSWMLWRNGGGAIAKIDSIANVASGTSVVTLTDPNDVRNFDIDDVCDASVDDGTGGAGIAADSYAVAEIDEDAGTVTFTGDLNGDNTWNPASFIFPSGDYAGALNGVPAYVCLEKPGTGTTPADIGGMDRTDHPTRLGGHRFSAGSADLVEEVKVALTKAYRRNADVTDLWTSPEAFDEIEGELGTLRRYSDVKVGRVGFTGLEFTAQSGKVVKLFSDPDIPLSKNGKRQLFGLNMDRWKLHSALDYPMWLTIDGKKDFMLEQSANQSEGRVGGYAQAYTDAPGEHFVLEFTT
jgi:hypothetical protein